MSPRLEADSESTSEIVPTLSGYSELDFTFAEMPLLLAAFAKYCFRLPLLIGLFDDSFLWGVVLVIGLIFPVPLSYCRISSAYKFGTFFEDDLPFPTILSKDGMTWNTCNITPDGLRWAYICFFFVMFLSISLKAIFVLFDELDDLEDEELLLSFLFF